MALQPEDILQYDRDQYDALDIILYGLHDDAMQPTRTYAGPSRTDDSIWGHQNTACRRQTPARSKEAR